MKFQRAIALAACRDVLRTLIPACAEERIIVAGSLRRLRAEVSDVEFVYVPAKGPVQEGLFTREGDLTLAALDQMLAEGVIAKRKNAKGSEMWGASNKFAIHCESGVPLDFFATTEECFFNVLVCRTGSAETNTLIAIKAQQRGLKWHPTGPGFEVRDLSLFLQHFEQSALPVKIYPGAILPVQSEADVFAFAGLAYREPRHR